MKHLHDQSENAKLRQQIAPMLMQAFLTKNLSEIINAEDAAKLAVSYADALIKELNERAKKSE